MGAWIEIMDIEKGIMIEMSLPTWERGLKFKWRSHNNRA